jgi:hypothetical protein
MVNTLNFHQKKVSIKTNWDPAAAGLLKGFCFFGLFFAGSMKYWASNKSIFELYKDPFLIGAAVQCVAAVFTFFTYKTTGKDYTYPAMFFFIFTKLISQYTHSKHYNIDGSKKKHHYDSAILSES